jgi:hypothetical protein
VEAGFAITSGGLQLRVARRLAAAPSGSRRQESPSALSPEPGDPAVGDA